MTAIAPELETPSVDWRTTASAADSPAGPLFSDQYAEDDLALDRTRWRSAARWPPARP